MIKSISFLLFSLIFLMGCKFYSFTGSSKPSQLKEIKVYEIENQAIYVEPELQIILNQEIKDRLIKNYGFNISQSDDAQSTLEIIITKFAFSTTDINPDNPSNQIRLSVALDINFENGVDETLNYKGKIEKITDFNSQDGDANNPGSSYELQKTDILNNIVEDLTDGVMRDIFGRW